jgi:hypothetical protein
MVHNALAFHALRNEAKSGPTERIDDRREAVKLANGEVRDPPTFATRDYLSDHIINRADQDVGDLLHVTCRELKFLADHGERGLVVAARVNDLNHGVQLDFAEPLPRPSLYLLDLCSASNEELS